MRLMETLLNTFEIRSIADYVNVYREKIVSEAILFEDRSEPSLYFEERNNSLTEFLGFSSRKGIRSRH